MKKFIYIIPIILLAATLQAELVPVNLKNINDDLSGIIYDEYSDILMNPAEISKLDSWKFHAGIDNLLNRNDLVTELGKKAKPKSITVSSPIMSLMGKQDSKEFNGVWVGTLYGQYNSHQYGLSPLDDINPNEPGQQTGTFWKINTSTITGTGSDIRKSTETTHYLNTENMNIGLIYGWKLNDRTNLGLMIKYHGISSQEPNDYSFTCRESTRTPIQYDSTIYNNDLNKNSNNYAINAGITKKLSAKLELGLCSGLAYVSEGSRSDGYNVLYNNQYDKTGDGYYNYTYYEWNTGLDDDNDTQTDEDGIDGSPGNLPGVDDDNDGRIDEDPSNINYKNSGIGLPVFINLTSAPSENLKLRVFLDTQLSFAALTANSSNYHYTEDTYDPDGDLIIGNENWEILSSTQTNTTGQKTSEYLQLGFGYEAKILKNITVFNGIKVIINAFQSTADWTKTEYYTKKSTTVTSALNSIGYEANTANTVDTGDININSTEYILQIPFGIEYKLSKGLGLQFGITWQLKHYVVKSIYSYSDKTQSVNLGNSNRRSEGLVYYMGLSLRLSDNMRLNLFNSMNELTRNSLLRWRASLKGHF